MKNIILVAVIAVVFVWLRPLQPSPANSSASETGYPPQAIRISSESETDSSTDQVAEKHGISRTIDLPPNQKLVNCGMDRDYRAWYLTRPMSDDENAETFTYTKEGGHFAGGDELKIIEHKE